MMLPVERNVGAVIANVDLLEAAIKACAGVRAAAVERESSADAAPLVAYVVMHDGSPRAAGSLRAQLIETVQPDIMPRRIIALTEMPVTATGDIDRAALPGCYGEVIEFSSPFAGPRTDVEHTVARIWSEVFGIDRPGLDDDFFELGGHSLLATHILWRIEESFALAFDIEMLFDARTIRQLASLIETRKGSTARESAS